MNPFFTSDKPEHNDLIARIVKLDAVMDAVADLGEFDYDHLENGSLYANIRDQRDLLLGTLYDRKRR